MAKVLIIVDYQNDWIDKSSEYYVGDVSNKIIRLNKLIKYCRAEKIQIIFTIHVEEGSTDSFVEGTKNVEIIDGVDFQRETDILIKKHRISPFYNTELENKLKELNADELIITGILTNLCVRSCVCDAYDRKYKIALITDTCVASPKLPDLLVQELEETRPAIKCITVDEFIK